MKTPTQIYNILLREIPLSNLSVYCDTNDRSGTEEIKINNFDIFIGYKYNVKEIDYGNGNYLTPSDFEATAEDIECNHLEVSFKGGAIEFTDEQDAELKYIITEKIK